MKTYIGVLNESELIQSLYPTFKEWKRKLDIILYKG